jgi:hypothetical protein
MPIFQDDLAGGQVPPDKPAKPTRPASPLEAIPMTRKLSEESIRTELCEGPLLETPEEQRKSPVGTLDTGFAFPIHGTSDRVELIERLKKGESPTWLPNRNVCINFFIQDVFNKLITDFYFSWSHCCKIIPRRQTNQQPMPQIFHHYCRPPKYQKQIIHLQSISNHHKQVCKSSGHGRRCIVVISRKGRRRAFQGIMGYFRGTQACTGQKDKNGLPHRHREISLHSSSILDSHQQTGSTLN